MGNRKISDNLKECALDLWNHGWPLEDICTVLQVSKSSLYRWRQIFEEHGTVARPQPFLIGRTRLLTRATLMAALEGLYNDDSDIFLDKACTWLGVQPQITIAPSTLCRNLQEAGLTRKILRNLATERNEVLREEFKLMLQTQFVGDGYEFVVVDETSEDQLYGRAPRGQQAHIMDSDVFVRGDRYSLCAALTLDGYLTAHPVPGSYNAEEIYTFIAEDVLPHMNPFPQPRSVLVLGNNCRMHHQPEIQELVESAGCILLFLPPYSPDLTPIEESFSALKAYIQCHGDQLRQIADPVWSLLEATSCITPEKSESWFKHAGYIVEQ